MASAPFTISNFDGTPEAHKLDHDHKREVDQRRKWAHGTILAGTAERVQPATPHNAVTSRAIKKLVHHNTAHHGGKWISVDREDGLGSDSSSAEDVQEPSAAPEPDAGITYSFDAARGPTPRGEILSMAINKAVERFETKETEKLVKNEYDVVAKEEDEAQGGYIADDDFELV